MGKNISPEALSGIFGLSLFTWILPILKLGFRKTLAIDDLYAIDGEMASEYLGHKTQREWDRMTDSVETPGKLRKGTLIWIISKTLNTSLFVPVLPRLFLTGFTFSQPFLVNRMIRYLQNSHEESPSNGYGLLGAYALVYIGIAIANGWYQRLTNRWIIMTRGSLITLIYNKTLTMSSTDDERLACTGLTLLVSKYIGERQRVWIQASQKRVNATANMLGWIKEIKMLGLESRFRSILESFRDQELKVSKAYRHLTLISIVLSYSTSILSPIAVFAIYTTIANRDHESLDISRMFTALTLISLLGTPLITLFQFLPSLQSALSCFQRIQVFVECAPRDDYRALIQPEPHGNSSSSTLISHEKSSDIASTFASASPDTDAIVIHDASIAWLQGKVAILHNISLRVAHGKLLMVVGPVGSGKSLLMKAMLGEVAILKGCISLSDQIGYCDQTPWLRNTSVRQNIIAPLPFDEAWYSTVLHACAIDKDIERFANGDLHAAGSGGINLSGGQKQRIALARAIYARRRLLILDDVFSGIDKETEGLIFHRLWGSDGLLRRLQATVVLATHATHRLRYSDQIFVLSAKGVPLEQGTLDELIASNGYIASVCSSSESKGQDSQELEEDTIAYKTKEENNVVVAVQPMNDAKHGISHQAKDRAIYGYYYKAIGAMHCSIFAMTAVAFGVFLKIPGISLFHTALDVQVYDEFREKATYTLAELCARRPLYTLWALQAWLGVVLDLTVAGLALIVVGLAVGLRDKVHSASLGVALLNLTNLGETIKNVLTEWTALENSMGAISRLESFERETPSENLAGEVQQPPANWPSVGRVEFKAVKASYRQDSTLALDDISLSIEAGQKIAVCGPSGSGKSSIVVALLGMLELSQGSISIDGIDLSTISRHEIRSRLSSVTQEPCYFPGTFRLNLDQANSISEERIIAILHKLELWAKIQQEGGLDAQLCFDAFSHGQKQLFCLARAILKPSKILILDEATSSVDKETAETMERVIAEECQEHTIIAIIHRLESIKYYDRIINLDNGKRLAEGT
ncbi:uncharacterized protein Triagg1_5845 [Trichoderma aggressivum f. europaeum]|uniref:ABC transporter n=1 Tax=Trichoderma aggressivum f. europaeum TaxID=173218 RepID=A0AAE1LY12_9HYPO|nr:hypothetical protein Triagg1_5845 [Trichoderma aggressivum f. europaeum]